VLSPVLVVVAALVALGAAVAVGSRVPRAAILGLVLAIAGAPFVADPLPAIPVLGARVVGALLGGYAIWISVRRLEPRPSGGQVPWPGAIALAAAGFAGGWLAADALGALLAGAGPVPLAGPDTALASGSPVAGAAVGAAAALAVVGLGPALFARDALRTLVGLLLVLTAVGLFAAVLGRPAALANVALGALTAGTGLAGAALIRRARASGSDLALHEPPSREPAVRARPVDEAHPAGPHR
jgi:hypothetical protein